MRMLAYVSVIIGCPIFLLGIIGNILNILIFTNRKSAFRRSPCSHYFVAISAVSSVHMLHSLPHRILSGGFGIDVTLTSIVFCKLRQCLIMSFPLMRNTLNCIATISQFFATSRQVHHRQKCTHKSAYLCIIVCIIFWSLHIIPYAILYEINIMPTTNMTRCATSNKALSLYTSWFVYNALNIILPSSMMAIFGYLTLRNVRCLGNNLNQHQTHQNIERKMSSVSYFFTRNIIFVTSILCEDVTYSSCIFTDLNYSCRCSEYLYTDHTIISKELETKSDRNLSRYDCVSECLHQFWQQV
jgi:hypothetical protein